MVSEGRERDGEEGGEDRDNERGKELSESRERK